MAATPSSAQNYNPKDETTSLAAHSPLESLTASMPQPSPLDLDECSDQERFTAMQTPKQINDASQVSYLAYAWRSGIKRSPPADLQC
eukprot:4933943-Amphidinium_carterae.3